MAGIEHVIGWNMGLIPVLALSAIIVIAYFLKGFSGFGPALILVPTVSILFSPALALPGSAFIDLFVGGALTRTLKLGLEERSLVIRMAGTMAVGTVSGALLAGIVEDRILLTLIGIVVFGMGVRLTSAHFEKVERPMPGLLSGRLYAGCLAGGLTGGLVGISGPFIVAGTSRLDKGAFRRILVALFLVESVLKVTVYAIVGIWSDQVLALAFMASPAVILGLVLGYRAHFHVAERCFHQVIGVILALLGAQVLISTYL